MYFCKDAHAVASRGSAARFGGIMSAPQLVERRVFGSLRPASLVRSIWYPLLCLGLALGVAASVFWPQLVALSWAWLLAAVVIGAVRFVAAGKGPNIHDRQLDLILATLLFATTAWVCLSWPVSEPSHNPGASLGGAVALVLGVVCATAGTRSAGKLAPGIIVAALALIPGVLFQSVGLIAVLGALVWGGFQLRRGTAKTPPPGRWPEVMKRWVYPALAVAFIVVLAKLAG